MITWLNAPANITPGTQASWQDVSGVGVPAGAKGVIVVFQNNVSASPPGDKDVGVRCKGSTDTFLSKGYWNNAPVGIGTQHEVHCAVDSAGEFQVYVQDTSLTTVWLIGYWEHSYDTYLFPNAIEVTPTRDGTWRTVSISAYTDGKKAIAAIVTMYQPDGNYEALGVRTPGYTGAEVKQGFWHNTVVVGLNTSQQFEANVDAGGASKVYLIGYLTGGYVAAHAVGPWVDPVVSDTWTCPTLFDRPAAGIEYVAAVGFFWYGVTPNSLGIRHRRWRAAGWDVHNKASKDGSLWKTMPLDKGRKNDQRYYDQPNQYGFTHGYIYRGLGNPANGTALIYATVADYTQRTVTAASWTEVTQYTLSWSALQAAGFAASDDVIIIAKANVGGSNAASLSGQMRASRGTTFAGATAWADSLAAHQPANGGAAFGHSWQWVKKHTLVSSENIYFGLQSVGADTARADDFVVFVFKLGGTGGLGPDDYAYAETTPAGDAGTSYTDGASVTLPGRKESSWAIFGSAHWLSDSATASVLQKIVVGSDSYSEVQYQGINTGEEFAVGNLAVVHYAGSDTTAKIQYRSDTASTHDCNRTAIFALRLDAFEAWTLDDNNLTNTLSALDTYVGICTAGVSLPNQSQTSTMLFFGAAVATIGENTKALYGRFRDNGSNEWPATGNDRASYMGNGAGDKIGPWWMGSKASLTGSYDLYLEAAEDSDVTPSYTISTGCMFGFVPRLAESKTSPEQFAYRGRNDDGSESAATWKASQNTTFSVAPNTTFRVRFGVNTKGADLPKSIKLIGRKAGKTWRQIS